MAQNIFENAKFGDRFRTRDGRMAIFVFQNPFTDECYVLFEGQDSVDLLQSDGRCWATEGHYEKDDIVSRWQEPIDEQELENMANSYSQQDALCDGVREGYSCPGLINAFKAGYRAAKQE